METLLKKFIREKLKNYVEPERRGTPKGDSIGLSKVKYEATLLMLTSAPYKEIAKFLNISHGLVLKWRTEPSFKATLDEHQTEFSTLFVKHILEVTSTIKDFNVPENYNNIDLNEFNGGNFSLDLFTMILLVLEELRNRLIEEFNLQTLPVVLDVFAFFTYTYYEVRLRDQGEADKLMREDYKFFYSTTTNLLSERIIKEVTNILKRKPLTESDRREALSWLDMVNQYFQSHIPKVSKI